MASGRFKKYTMVANEELELLRRRHENQLQIDPKQSTLSHLQQDMKQLLNRSDIEAEQKMALYQQLRHFFENIKNPTGPIKTSLPTHTQNPPQQPPDDEEDQQHVIQVPQQQQPENSVVDLESQVKPVEQQIPIVPQSKENMKKFLAELTWPPSASKLAHVPAEPIESASKFIQSLKLPDNRNAKATLLIEKILKNKNYLSCNSNGRLCIIGKEVENTIFKDLFRELFISKASQNVTGMDKFILALCKIHVLPEEISNSTYKDALKLFSPVQTGKGVRYPNPPGKRLKILYVYPC